MKSYGNHSYVFNTLDEYLSVIDDLSKTHIALIKSLDSSLGIVYHTNKENMSMYKMNSVTPFYDGCVRYDSDNTFFRYDDGSIMNH